MTTSNARKLTPQKKRIIMTSRRNRPCLRAQKTAGLIVLIVSAAALSAGAAAAAVLVPMALAAVFSKEKILDFNIFPRN